MNKGRLFIFSAASGTGKTSLAKALVERLPDLAFSVSHTTRAPRPGEQHGVHYYFVTPQQFDEMVAADRFLEHAKVFGNSYGTSRAATENLLRQGKNIILDIDWQGARAIKEKMPESVSVFILPPSRAALEERLTGRGQDSPEVIAQRMRAAVSEMSHYKEFDHVVVNDDFEAALKDLQAVIREDGMPRSVQVDIQALLAGV
jgi:guanylate kinase